MAHNERRFSYAHYLLANRAQVAQKDLIMKGYSLVIGIIVAAITCSNLLAEEKPFCNQTPPSSVSFKAAPAKLSSCI
ncbi:MAG: hypothetical protein WAN04_10645 [Candidatus Udaeobacter sp.]